MKRALRAGVLGVGTLGLILPVGSGAQQQPPGDTMELVFEREIFDYPSYQRANPFAPAVEDAATGPRFEDLTLIGIIYSSDPDLSVALLGEGVSYSASGELTLQEGRGGVNVGAETAAPQDTTAAADSMPQQEMGAPSIATQGYETYRVRQGDQLGNMRILEIQRMRVIVEVEEFGLTERREFVLRTPATRGGQP